MATEAEHRDPCRQSIRRFSVMHIPQPVYLGVDIEIPEEEEEEGDKSTRNKNTRCNCENGQEGVVCNYAISVHDGSYTTDYFSGQLCLHDTANTSYNHHRSEALSKLCDIIQAFSLAQHYKIHMVACSAWNRELQQYDGGDKPEQTAMSYSWSKLDALPVQVKTNGPTADERASAAVRKSVIWMSPNQPGNLPRTMIGFRHEVEVDFNYWIHMAGLADYRETVGKDTWRVLEELTKEFKKRDLKISFFSSTPQGGGVALMRHALLRFFNLLGIRAHWFVMRPKPEIYRITKQKFHNVLQGVAKPGVELQERDKTMFLDWTEENVNRFWADDNDPIKTSDVIVIDDPQVSGIIPHIRRLVDKNKKDVRVIFRSHIEIRADLLRDHPDGRESKTWNFLWDFIKYADLFIAHPVQNFVPDDVPRKTVALMPACTDPLDGLNKYMSGYTMDYYERVFNRMCVDQGAQEVDWERPYFVQVARFDPSKGIPDCLEAYSRLRDRLEKEDYDPAYIPQLVICGHGSIDDPEGAVIYEETHKRASRMTYASDVTVARLPPSDQLLNMILRNARAALQLSHREGFEIKVTEAHHKGIPVIAYDAGGIPLQIQDGVDGFLLPVGDTAAVADYMYRLLTDNNLHAKVSKSARACMTEEYFTVWNAMNWLHLFIEMTNNNDSKGTSTDARLTGEECTRDHNNSGIGNTMKVSDMWRKKYSHHDETKKDCDAT
ncbi:hypothetical protein BDB00DRAFT_869990 [Zychaea mexicana]|uniref:uncharacterized protein n=1 Tax=Zychaea mexicana TaxID=64656 RepID=UPI0022FE18DA|nr:uncharacterized protein BDB00DRAFT_869990 [Zychaea mexicana]KAI9495770.1 hypothetical protein BDB00DRAFT_869990 [Zychaea mexicana]